jgi:outer membrane protein OmpA-like peptidoglycan-associated protein
MSKVSYILFFITISVVISCFSSVYAINALEEDWWASTDFSEEYITSFGLNSYPDKLLKMGLEYYNNEEYDLAIKNLRESIAFYMQSETILHPRLSAAFLLLGKIYYHQKNYEDAIYCLERAFYSYGYLYNLEALQLLNAVKKEYKNYRIEQLFSSAKIPEPKSKDQESDTKKKAEKFDLNIPSEFFDMAHFEFDSSELTTAGKEVLDVVDTKLKENPTLKINIDGYCDAKGSEEYNMKLGQRRSNAAKDYLVNTHSIDPERLMTRSYGKQAPIDSNDTDEGRAKNRRIQFTVQLPEDQLP